MITEPTISNIESLESRWCKLLDNYQLELSLVHHLFQQIVAAYSERQRFYHNLNHLEHMFQELDAFESDGYHKVSNEILWAVWYHDIIYKPGAKTNEKKSANKAKEIMYQLSIQQSNINQVEAFILATEKHQALTDDNNTQLFLDADMCILGSNKIGYAKYCKAVRQEHSNIPDFVFYKGRKKFLSSVLKQESIFASDYFRNKYELAARENISNEMLAI